MTSTALVPRLPGLPAPVGGLDRYFQAIGQAPLLSAEEERQLAQRLRLQNDLAAAQRLILSHLRFVAHIARGYAGYGLPLADLIQEGNIGLMKAVKRFDPERGVRLVSFAVHWIHAEIRKFVLNNWRTVKVATTKAQHKLFFKLRGAKKQLGWLGQAEADRIAQDLGVTPEQVLEMDARLSGHDVSFDPPDAEGGDEAASYSPSAYLQAENADPATALEQENWDGHATDRLHQAMEQLDSRSRDIVQRRWLNEENKPTLHELAAEYRVSAERIRQLENNAMKKLRAALPAPA